MKETDRDPDNLYRPEWNDLERNYTYHDVGVKEFTDRCESHGLIVEPWGIDQREDDDGLTYDDRMDFKVYNEQAVGIGVTEKQLVALVDVKTKSNPRYMGRFNERHFDAYQEHEEDFEVPVYVVMFQVEGDSVVDGFTYRVSTEEPEILRSSSSEAVDSFPDNNNAVLIPHRFRDTWSDFANRILHG